MAQTQPVKNRPWFAVGNKTGDRTLAQQMEGLDRLFAEVEGKTVLDVGCAEGLISIELVKSGAKEVTGVEIRLPAVEHARKLAASMNLRDRMTFDCVNANSFEPDEDYDIVIMLAVLHKLKNPTTACARHVAHALNLVVIRLPPEHAPTIIDERSDNQPHHIGKTMERCGFMLEHEACDGPFGEWVGYYRRIKA